MQRIPPQSQLQGEIVPSNCGSQPHPTSDCNLNRVAPATSFSHQPIANHQPIVNQEPIANHRPIVSQLHVPWERYGLSQVEYDQICALFMTFDASGNGQLNRGELKRLARWLNYVHSDADAERLFRHMDSDGSGELTLHEFCTWLKDNKPDPNALYGLSPYQYNTILMAFHSFDTNNSGNLDVVEFENFSVTHAFASTREEARSIFYQIDVNRNGAVDLHEFLLFHSRNRRTSTQNTAVPYTSGYPGAHVSHRQNNQGTAQYQGQTLHASYSNPRQFNRSNTNPGYRHVSRSHSNPGFVNQHCSSH